MFATPDTLLSLHQHSLGRHVAQCQRLGGLGLGLRLRCWGEALHSLIAPRMFTTVVLLSLGSTALLAVAGAGA